MWCSLGWRVSLALLPCHLAAAHVPSSSPEKWVQPKRLLWGWREGAEEAGAKAWLPGDQGEPLPGAALGRRKQLVMELGGGSGTSGRGLLVSVCAALTERSDQNNFREDVFQRSQCTEGWLQFSGLEMRLGIRWSVWPREATHFMLRKQRDAPGWMQTYNQSHAQVPLLQPHPSTQLISSGVNSAMRLRLLPITSPNLLASSYL